MRGVVELLAEIQFQIGEKVFHRAQAEPEAGMITGITIRAYGVNYYVTWGNRQETVHYDYELSREHDFIDTTGPEKRSKDENSA